MPAALYFELDKNELAQTMAIIDEFSEAINHGLDYEHDNETLADFRDRLSAIRDKARERNLKYYASHHEELITALQGAIRDIVRFAVLIGKQGVIYTADDWTYKFGELSPYLALLDEAERAKIFDYMNYAYDHKEQIFREEEEKDTLTQNTPAVRTITSRSRELKLETTRVGRIIFEREEKSGFSNEAFYNRTDDDMPEVFTGTHPKNRRKEIFTFVSLKIENLQQEGRLEPFDGEVLCSSISLYAVGNEYTSPDAIYRHMLGNKRGAKLHPQMREAILASLRRLRLTNIIIRAEQEIEAGYSKKSRYEGVILPNEVIEDETVSLNGENVRDCVHFLRNSPLYDYADDKNQISRIPVAMLDVPADNDKEFIILKGYLTRRYAEAKNSNSKLGNIIRYDSLFAYIGIDSGNRKHTKRIRDKVKLILETWKKAGYITGYEEIKEGRTIAKIKIKLPRKKFHTE